MDDHAALLDALAAAPADDLLRLVYADWVEDHGDADRAAFIRAHVELARTDAMSAAFNPLATRVSDLFRKHYRAWYGDLAVPGETRLPDLEPPPRRPWFRRSRVPAWDLVDADGRRLFHGAGIELFVPGVGGPGRPRWPVDRFVVDRGLVQTAELSVGMAAPPAGFARHPVRRLCLRRGITYPPRFAFDGPHLGRVRELVLPTGRSLFNAEGLGPVLHSPHWHNLDTVTIPAGPTFPANVGREYLHPDGLRAIARSPLVRRLKTLVIGIADIDDEAPAVTAAATFDALDLYPADAGLTELALLVGDADLMHPDGYTRLAATPVARTLHRLDLTECGLDDAQLAALAHGPAWECLTHLNLAYNHFTDAGLISLAASAAFPRLRVLDLSHTDVVGFGLFPLAHALTDRPLDELILRAVPFDPDVRHTLLGRLGPRVRFE